MTDWVQKKQQQKEFFKDVLINGKKSPHYKLYKLVGGIAKSTYTENPKLNIKESDISLNLRTMTNEEIQNLVKEKISLKYKRDELKNNIKNFCILSYFLTRKKSIPCCFYTKNSFDLFLDLSDKKISYKTYKRLVNSVEELGFITANRYIDSNGTSKKNYRFDVVCPENNYATMYLVNNDAILSCYQNEINDLKSQHSNIRRLYYELISSQKAAKIIVEEENEENEDIEEQESFGTLFNGLYDKEKCEFDTINGKIKVLDIEKYKYSDIKNILFHFFKYLKNSGINTKNNILNSTEYNEIVSIIKNMNDNKISVDTTELLLSRKVFEYYTKGVSPYLFKLMEEYNSDKNDFTEKYMNINIHGKKSISGRVYSNYCKTSDKDGTRDMFRKQYKIVQDEDVSAMVPNLLKMLKNGIFEFEDSYTKIVDKMGKIGYSLTRNEVKKIFLMSQFSKSEKVFLNSVKRLLAFEHLNDKNNKDYYPYIKHFNPKSNSKIKQYLHKSWDSTPEGKKQLKLYKDLYNTIQKDYGSKQSSTVFFWESLLETIVTISLKRQGIKCYNVYDNFLSNKKFDLKNEIKKATDIIYSAYNNDLSKLRLFCERA